MRIFTYPNPFEINKNKELWEIVSKNPHFCASDTLVQGLGIHYEKDNFGILTSVDSLVKKVLGGFVDNSANDIQLFLNVSDYIRKMPDSNLKDSFRFNISDVVDSIKFLIMLECDPKEFSDTLNEEQNTLLDIYQQVIKSPCILPFNDLYKLNQKDISDAIKLTINDQIKYLCEREFDTSNKLHIKSSGLNTLDDGKKALHKLIKYYQNKIDNENPLAFGSDQNERKLQETEHLLSLIEDTKDTLFDKIIIHGVHKITPEIYFLVKLLEKNDIEVIFLINYAKNAPNIYKTWKNVYSWCDTKFEFVQDLNVDSWHNKLGKAILQVLEGKKLTVDLNQAVIKYDNLTSFTDNEVRKTFNKATDENGTRRLSKMDKQYYAVDGRSSNEILKTYFPEQFNEKPFLSYPIGQFILSIYQMWDFDLDKLSLNERNLSDCALSKIYKSKINIFNLIHKIKLYFSDCEYIDEYYDRIEILKKSLLLVKSNKRYAPLSKLSFFNVTNAELDEFKIFLNTIESIANKLFKHSDANTNIDFRKHFNTLVNIITDKSFKGGSSFSDTEKELLKEISNKLTLTGDDAVMGNIEDAKEALAYYLSTKTKGDTSNWIVRNFEQIDGGVLLSKYSKAKTIHFALLSNGHMTNQNDDVLSWPLTNEMFTSYKEINSAIPVVTTGFLERRNFLKFSLFYGTFFAKAKKFELSYIAEEEDKEQVPYYLFKILNLKSEERKIKRIVDFENANEKKKEQAIFSSIMLDEESKELFSICPYKFLQNKIMNAPIEYNSEYHIKYYVSNFLVYYMKTYFNFLNLRDMDNKDTANTIENEFSGIRKLFPFWDKVTFYDIENNAKKQISASSGIYSERYKRRKENFLIAKWVETDSKVAPEKRGNQMDFKKATYDSIKAYMESSQLYPIRKELPHKKVCENCNYTEVCLRDYYDAISAFEEEEYDVRISNISN